MVNNKTISWRAWCVWGVAAGYFFADYVARVSPGVMAHQLQMALHISAAGLGSLAAYFYYPYVAMQIPVGLLVDRYRIRVLLTLMAVITAFGCMVFGLSSAFYQVAIGRCLIGFSAAFAFVSALKLATNWFHSSQIGLLSGLTQALGMLGAAVGEAPVAFMVSHYEWRASMLMMAIFFVALALLIYVVVRDHPPALEETKWEATRHDLKVFDSLCEILKNRQTWINGCYVGLLFAPTAVIGEFWGPAYLQYGRGLEAHSAAWADGLIFLGWGIGGPITGWLSDKVGRRKPIMLFSAFCGLLILSVLLFKVQLSLQQEYVLLFLFGLTNTGVCVSYAVATEINPRRVLGTSLAFTNMSSVIVGAFLQQIVGRLIDWQVAGGVTDISKLTLSDFNAALWLLPLCSLLAMLMSLAIRETYCRPLREA